MHHLRRHRLRFLSLRTSHRQRYKRMRHRLRLMVSRLQPIRMRPDPPNRVARLQYMSGSVSIQPQGTGDWAAGVINRPLTSSDNVWTDKDSRAELNVGSGLIRMSSESSLTLTSVSDNTTQLELHQGTLSLRVHNLAPGETYEIDTPNTAFTVQTAGEYRVDVDSNGNTSEVTVRRGEGQASNNGSSVAINAGQQAHFGGW